MARKKTEMDLCINFDRDAKPVTEGPKGSHRGLALESMLLRIQGSRYLESGLLLCLY